MDEDGTLQTKTINFQAVKLWPTVPYVWPFSDKRWWCPKGDFEAFLVPPNEPSVAAQVATSNHEANLNESFLSVTTSSGTSSQKILTVPKIVAQCRQTAIPYLYTLGRTIAHAYTLPNAIAYFNTSIPYLNTALGSDGGPFSALGSSQLAIAYLNTWRSSTPLRWSAHTLTTWVHF